MSLAWKGTPGRWSPEASGEKKCLGPFAGPGEVHLQGQKHHKREVSPGPLAERHVWKGCKGSRFPSHRHTGEPHQGLPPPLPLLTEGQMDCHIPNNGVGRFKILISSLKYWSAVHGPQTRAMGCFPSGLYNLLCLEPSPNKLNQNPFYLCWGGLKTEGRGVFTRSFLLPKPRVSPCQGSPPVPHVPG